MGHRPAVGAVRPTGTGRTWTILAAIAVTATVSCSSSGSAAQRPTTTARLQIVSPTPNQVAGPDTKLELNLVGAKVVAANNGPVRPDEGHIHVSVDGKLVSMAYGTSQDLTGLTPGTHSVQAEFVATDHAPFQNRVVAAVLFQVAGGAGAQPSP